MVDTYRFVVHDSPSGSLNLCYVTLRVHIPCLVFQSGPAVVGCDFQNLPPIDHTTWLYHRKCRGRLRLGDSVVPLFVCIDAATLLRSCMTHDTGWTPPRFVEAVFTHSASDCLFRVLHTPKEESRQPTNQRCTISKKKLISVVQIIQLHPSKASVVRVQ